MRILAVGGGSGGHVTPVAAIVSELQSQGESHEIRFWCDRKFLSQAAGIMHAVDPELRVDTIASGKFRRYHNIPWWRQLIQFRTILLPNIIDTVKIVAGTVQSIGKLLIWRPDVIFTKGGFVCLPVGVAAKLLRIPLVIHDSDTHPGLTNKILSRWAAAIATGAPLEYYPYPVKKSHYTGIPLSGSLQPVSGRQQAELKAKFGVEKGRSFVVITGGGLGAKAINDCVQTNAKALNEIADVLLVTGKELYEDTVADFGKKMPKSLRLEPFLPVDDLHEAFAAADVVVGRAGATTLLELAALHKPTILIPNAQLTGGHQLTNAERYEDKGAAVVLHDEELVEHPERLVEAIQTILDSPGEQKRLAQAIAVFARPDAAKDVANLIIASKRP